MTKHECVKLWRKKPMVLIFKIPHRWTACLQDGDIYELVQFALILTGIVPPTNGPQLTSVLKSILRSVGP